MRLPAYFKTNMVAVALALGGSAAGFSTVLFAQQPPAQPPRPRAMAQQAPAQPNPNTGYYVGAAGIVAAVLYGTSPWVLEYLKGRASAQGKQIEQLGAKVERLEALLERAVGERDAADEKADDYHRHLLVAAERHPDIRLPAGMVPIGDNRSAELAAWDEAARDATIRALEADGIPMGTLGFEPGELGADLADDDEGEGLAAGDGSTLRKLEEVTYGEPDTPVQAGETWQLGPHVLCVVDVFTGWPAYVPHLGEPDAGRVLVPYPGPLAVLGPRAEAAELVLVQPDPIAAAYIADAYRAARGQEPRKVG